jgi:hypothetical protein
MIRQVERNVLPTSDEPSRELEHPAYAAESPQMRLDESDPKAAVGTSHGL